MSYRLRNTYTCILKGGLPYEIYFKKRKKDVHEAKATDS